MSDLDKEVKHACVNIDRKGWGSWLGTEYSRFILNIHEAWGAPNIQYTSIIHKTHEDATMVPFQPLEMQINTHGLQETSDKLSCGQPYLSYISLMEHICDWVPGTFCHLGLLTNFNLEPRTTPAAGNTKMAEGKNTGAWCMQPSILGGTTNPSQ
jgi:hypothetical protein